MGSKGHGNRWTHCICAGFYTIVLQFLAINNEEVTEQ